VRAFVVADAHGRHDLVRGLLEQEGLLRHDPRKGTLVVQIGDLCNCVSTSVEEDRECLARARDWFNVYLVGNHEHPYFGGPAFSGFWPDPLVKAELQRCATRGLLRAAIAIDGILVSHAGLTSRWGALCQTAEEAETWIAREWAGNQHGPLFSSIGSSRGGWDKSGGLLWADWSEPKRMAFNQLVGHTVGKTIRRRNSHGHFATCIDLGASKEVDGALAGAWLLDGKVEIVTYSGSH
jgi:hypothetical protein